MANTVVRWAGLVQITGAALLGTALVITSSAPEMTQPIPPLPNSLLFLSSVLLLLSLPAMYARQANAAGWLGLAGHALLQTGILLLVVVSTPPLLFSSFDLAFEESLTPFLLAIALTAGLLLTATATLRAGVFPRWTGILLLAGTAGFFFSFFVAETLPRLPGQVVGGILGILLALSFAGIGLSMWTTFRGRPGST